MGATVEVVPPRPWISKAVDINIEDRKGREVFTLCCDRNVDPQVLNVAAADRHLLLYANGERFLCGHDERHWFVAAVSERVSTVREAKTALLPPGLREEALRLTGGRGLTRKNDLFHRQGEWFFRRVTDWDEIVALNRLPVHKNEAVRRARTRGRAKPHFCEEVVRRGGISVAILSGGVEMT
jgi:hypothetical protein